MRAVLLLLALSGCASSTDCLYNPYDLSQPQRSCATGLTLPGGVLKDNDVPKEAGKP